MLFPNHSRGNIQTNDQGGGSVFILFLYIVILMNTHPSFYHSYCCHTVLLKESFGVNILLICVCESYKKNSKVPLILPCSSLYFSFSTFFLIYFCQLPLMHHLIDSVCYCTSFGTCKNFWMVNKMPQAIRWLELTATTMKWIQMSSQTSPKV